MLSTGQEIHATDGDRSALTLLTSGDRSDDGDRHGCLAEIKTRSGFAGS
jgi:hypothetical protein